MKIKEKILDNLVPILISILAIITVLPILTYSIEDNYTPSLFIDIFSMIITAFWFLFFAIYGIVISIKDLNKDREVFKNSVRNLKFSFPIVLVIVVGSFLYKEHELDKHNEIIKQKRYLIIKEEEASFNKVIDSLKNIGNRDSLISTFYFSIGEEFTRFGFHKEGFDKFDSALYHYKSSEYYSKIAYYLKYNLHLKEKALKYERLAYELDTTKKYLLNIIKELEKEIEEETN